MRKINKTNEDRLYDLIVKSGYQNNETLYIFEVQYNKEKSRRYYSVQGLLNEIRPLEVEALSDLKKGEKILDVGAGAGRISIYLQKKGYNITALDKSNVICKVLKKRGVKKVINADIFEYLPKKKYDVLLFVRVYSIFGKKEKNINNFFNHIAEKVLKKDGKLIFVLADTRSGVTEIMKRRFVFNKKIGDWLESLHPSLQEIIRLAKANNFSIEKLKKNDSVSQYFLILKNLKGK